MVTPGNKEIGSGELGTISCTVTGLTVALGTVQWKDSTGTDVTTLAADDGKTDFTKNDGTFEAPSQTVSLTVPKDRTSADAFYTCVITPGEGDDATAVETTVALDVFSK